MQRWTGSFDFFLFDFDGLLVDTEKLHFKAYVEMCRQRGFTLGWTLSEFFKRAHFSAEGLREGIYAQFPELYAQEPRWEILYAEKKRIYQRFLEEGHLELMPGVKSLLERLVQLEKKRCVVTNSFKGQVDEIKKHLPLLKTIPVWITRECYERPKPAPDGYQKALKLLGKEGERTIGFEDSMRGLRALLEAGIDHAVLVSSLDHPQMEGNIPEGVERVTSFESNSY